MEKGKNCKIWWNLRLEFSKVVDIKRQFILAGFIHGYSTEDKSAKIDLIIIYKFTHPEITSP